MDWDDEFDEMMHVGGRADPMPDEVSSSGLDPMDISDPASAYFLLSDDAQDEITGSGKKKMTCLSCGHTFVGDIYDRCPECFSPDTEQMTDENDDRFW